MRLLTKPGCHLCDEARGVVERVCAEALADGIETVLDERDILSDPALARRHSEDIPVLFIGEKRHAVWRVDPERLRAALDRAARRRPLSRRPGNGGSP
ncbi:glutaredoxin family protein [Leucobacter weissii]|uniref:Glutaredoxin family protein n=1 Tax=Leucobacter weissii TaxID=1983706 RepID=A0A939MKW5_9MICO|nr:glutaredoxin family protein [Leucobacter weissii]MBO1900517.1 glutaredoxin family protein [Leucobacter weissii]